MRWLLALGLPVAFVYLNWLLLTHGPDSPIVLLPALVISLGSAAWAAYDASRLELGKYEGGCKPLTAFVGVFLVWIWFFPRYILTRSRRVAGELPPVAGLPRGCFGRGVGTGRVAGPAAQRVVRIGRSRRTRRCGGLGLMSR